MTNPIASSHRLKILLIDDSNFCLRLAEEVLSSEGFDVRCAQNLLEFVAVLSNWDPDLVITDVEMPETRGDELCLTLRRHMKTKETPLVLFSALPESDLEEMASESHADAFLSKTNGYAQLGSRVRELTEIILW